MCSNIGGGGSASKNAFNSDKTILKVGDPMVDKRFSIVKEHFQNMGNSIGRQALNYAWHTPRKYYRTHSVNEAIKELTKRAKQYETR